MGLWLENDIFKFSQSLFLKSFLRRQSVVTAWCQPWRWSCSTGRNWEKPDSNWLRYTICNNHAIYMLSSCYLHAIYMLSSCYLHAIFMQSSWYLHAILMQSSYNLHAIFMQTSCNLHATSWLNLCFNLNFLLRWRRTSRMSSQSRKCVPTEMLLRNTHKIW